jgi:hypothetical protein
MELRKVLDLAKASGYSMIGVRADDKAYQVGAFLDKSHDWDFEHDCSSDSLLSGTCTLSAHFWFLDGIDGDDEDIATLEGLLKQIEQYGREHSYLVGGDSYDLGDDSSEVIIKEAVLICTIK